MSIFDKLKGTVSDVAKAAREAVGSGNQTETIVIGKLPESLEELKALPEAAMDTPFKTAALTVCALCAYAADKEIGISMLDFLRGPGGPLSAMERQFLKDRFADEKFYVPFSYFEGATPENEYAPAEPFTLKISSNPYSFQNEGYATLWIRSGGADSPRQVDLRKAGTGVWYLRNHQGLTPDIRKPKSLDPWA